VAHEGADTEAQIRLLDELGANATAATTVQTVDGWWLRCAPDLPFRRSNTVVPLAAEGPAALDVEARIDLVEEFYRRRGRPARFQVSPSSAPEDLDRRLEKRGYTIDAPVEILVGEVATVLDALDPVAGMSVTTADHVSDRWAQVYGGSFGEDLVARERLEAYARLLRNIGPACVAVLAEADGQPVAVGMGVIERRWLGVYGLATRTEARGKGAARAVLGALARAGRGEGCSGIYIQVEVDNDSAQRLYRGLGFTTSHAYHYRVLDLPG
jgi:N-acetylglutamate synthase